MKNNNDFKAFKNSYKILKSHKLKNGFISITYIYKYSKFTGSVEVTTHIENIGTPYNSLFLNICG